MIITGSTYCKFYEYLFYMHSFNDGKNKFLFHIEDGFLEISVGIDKDSSKEKWAESIGYCPSFDKETKKIDWITYLDNLRYDKDLHISDPFIPEFKKYAQSILNLLAFT